MYFTSLVIVIFATSVTAAEDSAIPSLPEGAKELSNCTKSDQALIQYWLHSVKSALKQYQSSDSKIADDQLAHAQESILDALVGEEIKNDLLGTLEETINGAFRKVLEPLAMGKREICPVTICEKGIDALKIKADAIKMLSSKLIDQKKRLENLSVDDGKNEAENQYKETEKYLETMKQDHSRAVKDLKKVCETVRGIIPNSEENN